MNLSEINWDMDAAGTWPLPIKIAAVVLVCVLVAAGWVYMDTMDQRAELEKVTKQEDDLKKKFEIKQKKAVNLETYKEQLQDMEESFGTMLRQLPDRTEVASLLVDVSQTGLASGLEFELFKPQGEVKKGFYAELPINVKVLGGFAEFGTFVSGLASLPRIVTIHNVNITPGKDKTKMKMSAVVKTYRYLEDGTVAKKKGAKSKRKRR